MDTRFENGQSEMHERDEWELSKENVLPLRQGRRTADLTAAALQPKTVADHNEIRQQRMEFEAELRTYDGDDPLDVWDRYISWAEQMYPKGGKDSHIQEMLQQCVSDFKDDERYKNDTRFLTIWIKFANICKAPLDIYSFLFNHKIGFELASFYDAWALELERSENIKKADAIYSQGIDVGAQPSDMLKRKHCEFQARVARRIAGEIVAPPESITTVEEPKRTVLGALKSKGSKARVGVDRASSSLSGSQGLRSSVPPQQISRAGGSLRIFNDENAAPTAVPAPSGDWASIPSKDNQKENEIMAGKWTKAKMKQKHMPVVKINEISSVVHTPFSIHTEADIPEPASAKKIPKHADPFYNVQHHNEDPSMKPMYCKNKIYVGALEFSFEELRAARWMDKWKKLEEQKKQEEFHQRQLELMKQEDELRRREEQMQTLQHELQQKERLMLEQQQMEQKRLQMQEKMAKLAVNQSSSSNRSITRREKLQQANQGLNIDESLTPSTGIENSTPNISGVSQQVDLPTPRMEGNSSNITPNMQNFTSGTYSGSRNSSMNRSSFRNTSNSSSKLSAPSPTINTKQAMAAVRGMFNDTDMNDQFGWGPSEQSSEDQMLEMHFAKGNSKPTGLAMNTDAPFKIFEEKPQATIPAVSSSIVTDKRHAAQSMAFPNKFENMSNTNVPVGVDKENNENLPPVFSMNSGSSTRLGSQNQPLPRRPSSEDVEMNEDPVVAVQHNWDTEHEMDGIADIPSELTFAPISSSTCNFTYFAEAARLASTPFNPAGGMAPLDAPPVSNIKPGLMKPGDDTETSSCTNNSENTISTIDDKFSRRSSMFAGAKGGQTDLSPIIERSDEDAKSHVGSSFSSHCGEQHGLTGRTHSSSGSTGSNPDTTADAPGALPCNNEPVFMEALQTISEEESSRVTTAELPGNRSCHEIDVTNYVPQTSSDRRELMMNMSVMIDLNDPFDEEAIDTFLSKLPEPLSSHPNYHSCRTLMHTITPGNVLPFGNHHYEIVKKIGSGAFASVYIVKRQGVAKSKAKPEVMKIQQPGWPWEFYICTTLHRRMALLNATRDMRPSVMSINEGYFFLNGSAMTNTLHSYGTVLDLVNMYKKLNRRIPHGLMLLIVIDLMSLLEQMHTCHVIHGDIKPDNLLFTQISESDMHYSDPSEFLAKRKPCIKLIDFGRSIDMEMYPENTTFMAKVNTSGFTCIEMKTNQPWTYQVDLFGLLASIHVFIFKRYMNVHQCHGRWKMTSRFIRHVSAVDVWQGMFDDLLNIASCDDIPDLAPYRRGLEEEFVRSVQLEMLSEVTSFVEENLAQKS